jgi:hypothetical protein
MCQKRGGNLATIYNPVDYLATAYIRQQILNTNNRWMWIAGNDNAVEGKWVMPDGKY